MGVSHRGIPLNKNGDNVRDKRIAPILTPAEKTVCVQRGLLELFDTQAIDEIGVYHYSRAHHVSDTSWSSPFGSRNTLDHEQNEPLLAPSLG